MYKVLIAEPCKNDLKNVIDYISNELKNPSAAMDLLNSFEKEISSLSDMPGRYSLVNDDYLSSKGIRAVKIKNYLAFYKVNKNLKTVTVVRFLYGKRMWNTLLSIN